MLTPDSPAAVQEAVRTLERVVVSGGGTKSALSRGANVSLAQLTGILEYDPSEYTFTAAAGTTLAQVRDLLAQHGQYLPFDPPLVDRGATLGGTVAAGLSGSGRLRYGGVRDFLLGVRLVSGEGRVVYGGGKVVKNAAGFDLPKLMVGSRGQFGVMVELTFKVFPRPAAYGTLAFDLPHAGAAIDAMLDLARSAAEPACLDFEPPQRLWVRVGGMASALPERLERVRRIVPHRAEVLLGDDDAQTWRDVREFQWLPRGYRLARLPLVPDQILTLEAALVERAFPVPRRYSVAGNLACLGWPDEVPAEGLATLCRDLQRTGVALTGEWDRTLLGEENGSVFATRLAAVFDPHGKFRHPARHPAGSEIG